MTLCFVARSCSLSPAMRLRNQASTKRGATASSSCAKTKSVSLSAISHLADPDDRCSAAPYITQRTSQSSHGWCFAKGLRRRATIGAIRHEPSRESLSQMRRSVTLRVLVASVLRPQRTVSEQCHTVYKDLSELAKHERHLRAL